MNVEVSRSRIPVILAFLLLTTTSCSGIGGWRKKSAASQDAQDEQTADNNDSNSNTNYYRSDIDMNKTYLDLFGESTKDFLTRKAPERVSFPHTDQECSWDWRYFRCEPFCECSLQPKIPGDFHLGRACRKRVREEEGLKNEENQSSVALDELYLAYCSLEDSDGAGNDSRVGKNRTPPPPSIPSPFPFISKTSKATWRVVRTKADPIVDKMTDELDGIRHKVQDVVCRDLKTRCSEEGGKSEQIETTDDSVSAFTLKDVAWQERLFCSDMVRDCT